MSWAPPGDGCLAGYGRGITISIRRGYRRVNSGIIVYRGGVRRLVAGLARGWRKVRTPRAGCWVTPRRSDPTPAQQKAHRRWPAFSRASDQARVKWRGKSPPRSGRHGWAAKVTRGKAKKEGGGGGDPG